MDIIAHILFVFDRLWPGIVAGIVVAAIIWIVTYLIQGISGYSGVWINQIFEDDTRSKIVKQDVFKIRHRKLDQTVKGRFKRIYPKNAIKKSVLSGVIHGDNLIFTYWCADQTIASRGCCFVSISDSITENGKNIYSGQYYKKSNNSLVSVEINLIKLPKGTRYSKVKFEDHKDDRYEY